MAAVFCPGTTIQLWTELSRLQQRGTGSRHSIPQWHKWWLTSPEVLAKRGD
jgi:hypothetical protein